MGHDHQVLIPGPFVTERGCGYVPYSKIVGHTPDDLRRDVCNREASSVASRTSDDFTMTSYLCTEHTRVIQDCPGCRERNIEVTELGGS